MENLFSSCYTIVGISFLPLCILTILNIPKYLLSPSVSTVGAFLLTKKRTMFKWIKLGDYLEAVIHVVTLGFGSRISEWIAVKLLGKKSCGCCERKQWLNRLTDKNYNGRCNEIQLF